MAELICAACSRPAGQGMILCSGCGDRMANRLFDVRDLISELETTRAHLDVMTVAAGRGGEQGLPFSAPASSALAQLESTVTYWVMRLAEHRGCAEEVPQTVPEGSVWLARRLDWLRAMETAGQAYCDVDVACSRAWCVVDRPMHRTRFSVGPCPEVRATVPCTGTVWAYIPVRMETEQAVMRCQHPDCERHAIPWTCEQWRRVGIRILRRRAALQRTGR